MQNNSSTLPKAGRVMKKNSIPGTKYADIAADYLEHWHFKASNTR